MSIESAEQLNKNDHNSDNLNVHHETTLFAESIFHWNSFSITNSLLMSWITVFILIIFFFLVGKRIKKYSNNKLSSLQNFFEIIIEQALNMADGVTGARAKTEKFLPVVLTLFLFILVNNWLGLFPGVGTIGFIESGNNEKIFIPLLRGATADLNTTLALSLFSVVLVHFLGITMIGAKNHFTKFINIKAFLDIFKKAKQDPTIVMVNPIKIFVGFIEIIGEIAKVASLSLRLFGNIFAGEVLLASMMTIFAFFLPLPFMFLEIIVGIVQALVFAILTLAFMSIATTAEEH